MIQSIINDIQQLLEDSGLKRSERNFTLENVAATRADKAFTFGDVSITPVYQPGDRVNYDRLEVTLLVLCKVFGDHNPTAKASQGYLEAFAVYETVEDVVVHQQQSLNGEDCRIVSATLQPFDAGNNDELLMWRFRIGVEAHRTMNN